MDTTVLTDLKLEDIPLINMGQHLLNKMKQFGDRVAMVDGQTEKEMTYNQLIERTKGAAAGLQKLGVCKDDVICVMSPNHMDYLVACYASAVIYATFQPINPLYTAADMTKALKQCNSKFIITIPELIKKTEEALEPLSPIKVIVFGEAEGYTTFESLVDSKHGEFKTPEGDPKTSIAALMSSSGTTGFPKPVQISHYAFVTNSHQQMTVEINRQADCFVSFLPFFHVYGLYYTSYYIHTIGAKIVIMSRFQPDTYLHLIEKYKPKSLQVVPPVMVLFSKYPKLSNYDLSSVENIVCGAAPLSKEIEDAVKSKLNLQCIQQGFGMTELGVTHCNSKYHFKHKSVGRILPLVEMKIVDVESRKTLGTNEEGEMLIRGPQVCSGYLNLPEENANLFTEDGWVKTGDVGRVDEDGYLFVVDRLKQLIKYKGYQVAPATLEDIILSHDGIADVGVVGLPDEEAGELPRAYVVKKAGHDDDVTEEEIVSFVNNLVAPHMKLRGGVEFVKEIPRTVSGKILRKTLKEDAIRSAAAMKSA